MSASLNYRSLDVRPFGETTTVPNDDLAKLMYYLQCVAVVIRLDGFERYTDYTNYYSLSKEDKEMILGLAIIFTPKEMISSSLFLVGSRYVTDSENQFYELTGNTIGLHVNSEVIIGGVSRKVLKVMGCTESWLDRNYYKPISNYTTDALIPGQQKEACCDSFCENAFCRLLENCFNWSARANLCGELQWPKYCKRCYCLFTILFFIVGIILIILFK